MANREALRRARALREQFRNRGEFTQCEYREALAGSLESLRDEMFDESVDAIAGRVDRESTDREDGDDGQLTLFDMEGEYKTGTGVRIAKKISRIQHAESALVLHESNLIVQQTIHLRKLDELRRLRPYWGPEMTKQEAVEAYRAANPDNR